MLPAIVAFALGSLAVIQAALNRTIAAKASLVTAVTLNAIVVMIGALIYFLIAGARPSEVLNLKQFGFWVLIPGLIGLGLISGLPWAIQRIGALQVFVLVVAAQMITSSVWDAVVEELSVSPMRIVGALLAVGGAILTFFAR